MKKILMLFLLIVLSGCKTVYVEVPVECDCECDVENIEEDVVDNELEDLVEEATLEVGDSIIFDGVKIKLSNVQIVQGETYEKVLFTTWIVNNETEAHFDFFYDVDIKAMYDDVELSESHSNPSDSLLQSLRRNLKVLEPNESSTYGRSFHDEVELLNGTYSIIIKVNGTEKYFEYRVAL